MTHPGTTRVSTTDRFAPVRLDAIDSTTRVVTFDKHGGARIRRKGYEARRVRTRRRNPALVRVSTTAGHRLDVSPDHRVLTQWSAAPGVAVYMMRADVDGLWRVGAAELHMESEGYQFGPARRASEEGGDALWILDVAPDRRTAHRVERSIVDEFGIDDRCYHRMRHAPRADLDPRPLDALAAYGRFASLPFWRRGELRQLGCRASMHVAAANVLPGWMVVGTDECEPRVRWRPCAVERGTHDGPWYALSVPSHGHYIADGVIVRDAS